MVEKGAKHQQDHQCKTDAKQGYEGVERVAEQNLPGDFYIVEQHK